MGEEATEEGLDKALRESECEAEQQEQRQLLEAQIESILLSKSTDSPPRSAENAQDVMSLVLLSFTRFPKDFRDALLTSPLALRLLAEGVELQPPWACPRLVLAQGVTKDSICEDREWWNAVVRAIDEDAVHEIRLTLNPDIRPRVKDRFVVPTGESLFDIGSSSNAVGEVNWKSPSFCPSTELGKLMVKNTFLDGPAERASSCTRAASAPPRLRL